MSKFYLKPERGGRDRIWKGRTSQVEEEEEGRGKGTVRGTVHLVIVSPTPRDSDCECTYRTFPRYI